mmetsp:Transcript_108457/g.338022  ORF Transcript_108457/g.338022 Transcript_108457/m.338022 type:complete len:337 (+) Transcript_108457:223-1233(+)
MVRMPRLCGTRQFPLFAMTKMMAATRGGRRSREDMRSSSGQASQSGRSSPMPPHASSVVAPSEGTLPCSNTAAAAFCRCNSSLSAPRSIICMFFSCCRDLEQSCIAPRIDRAACRLRAMSSCLIFSTTAASLTFRNLGSPTSLRLQLESGNARSFFLNSPRSCSHWPSASSSRILRSTLWSPVGARDQRGRRLSTGAEASERLAALPRGCPASLGSSAPAAADSERRAELRAWDFRLGRDSSCPAAPEARLPPLPLPGRVGPGWPGSSAPSSISAVSIVAPASAPRSGCREPLLAGVCREEPLFGREGLLFGLPGGSLSTSTAASCNGSRAPPIAM